MPDDTGRTDGTDGPADAADQEDLLDDAHDAGGAERPADEADTGTPPGGPKIVRIPDAGADDTGDREPVTGAGDSAGATDPAVYDEIANGISPEGVTALLDSSVRGDDEARVVALSAPAILCARTFAQSVRDTVRNRRSVRLDDAIEMFNRSRGTDLSAAEHPAFSAVHSACLASGLKPPRQFGGRRRGNGLGVFGTLVACVVLLVIGGFIGHWIAMRGPEAAEMADLRDEAARLQETIAEAEALKESKPKLTEEIDSLEKRKQEALAAATTALSDRDEVLAELNKAETALATALSDRNTAEQAQAAAQAAATRAEANEASALQRLADLEGRHALVAEQVNDLQRILDENGEIAEVSAELTRKTQELEGLRRELALTQQSLTDTRGALANAEQARDFWTRVAQPTLADAEGLAAHWDSFIDAVNPQTVRRTRELLGVSASGNPFRTGDMAVDAAAVSAYNKHAADAFSAFCDTYHEMALRGTLQKVTLDAGSSANQPFAAFANSAYAEEVVRNPEFLFHWFIALTDSGNMRWAGKDWTYIAQNMPG